MADGLMGCPHQEGIDYEGVTVLGEHPTRSAIIDGEIVGSDAAGMPDFWSLFLRSAKLAELHVWAFDLLALDGKDLRKLPLERR